MINPGPLFEKQLERVTLAIDTPTFQTQMVRFKLNFMHLEDARTLAAAASLILEGKEAYTHPENLKAVKDHEITIISEAESIKKIIRTLPNIISLDNESQDRLIQAVDDLVDYQSRITLPKNGQGNSLY